MFQKASKMMVQGSGGVSLSRAAWIHWDGLLLASFSLAFAVTFINSRKVPTGRLGLGLRVKGLGLPSLLRLLSPLYIVESSARP